MTRFLSLDVTVCDVKQLNVPFLCTKLFQKMGPRVSAVLRVTIAALVVVKEHFS